MSHFCVYVSYHTCLKQIPVPLKIGPPWPEPLRLGATPFGDQIPCSLPPVCGTVFSLSVCTTHEEGLELLIQPTSIPRHPPDHPHCSPIVPWVLLPFAPGLSPSKWCALLEKYNCILLTHLPSRRVPGWSPALWGCSELVQFPFSVTSLQLFKSSSQFP